MRKSTSGFTVIELLIVIVIIAVLAVITVVAYNGIQARASYSAYKNTLKSMQKAIMLYQTDNGYFPRIGTTASCATSNSNPTTWIPDLSPAYISTLPVSPNSTDYYAYCWSANGVDYKIMRIVPGGVSLPQQEINQATTEGILDSVRPTRAWGLWSPGCSGC